MFENAKGKVISIDFDGTLDNEYIQDLVKDLMGKGAQIIVTTRRYSDEQLMIPENKRRMLKLDGGFKYNLSSNDDLYSITDKLQIPRNRIHFTNMTLKALYFDENYFNMLLYPVIHIDDDINEIIEIQNICPDINCIHVNMNNIDLYVNALLENTFEID